MNFEVPLVRGRLTRRYNRFLADVTLDTGEEVVAHCPNPGAMLGLKDPGLPVWLEPNDDPRRKLRYGWRLVELEGGNWAGIDASLPNRVVREALEAGHIPELASYSGIRAEVKYGQRSRVDFLLTEPGLPQTYVEVKNVHLRRTDDWAEFPDSVTTRGARHMEELAAMVAAGHRSVLVYLVQRTDCRRFRLAGDIDPAYAKACREAHDAGVQILCHGTKIGTDGIDMADAIEVHLDPAS
ncbi:Sugar/maltose fermentation stimulation protein [Rhodovulum sp. P5]|uniref:DNA/RNA nuclease SfsA n=1 Tax=Rhodovulum sp. P5 TaxID=1564506 RepID=UPI0009C1B392|nr:DNA/RNA nuclease SfsA [Rhodovulum sp. P5]ARE41459.1 Sugar/maltose fermentation stimulation protein [Rhodovulum sp. P5]